MNWPTFSFIKSAAAEWSAYLLTKVITQIHSIFSQCYIFIWKKKKKKKKKNNNKKTLQNWIYRINVRDFNIEHLLTNFKHSLKQDMNFLSLLKGLNHTIESDIYGGKKLFTFLSLSPNRNSNKSDCKKRPVYSLAKVSSQIHSILNREEVYFYVKRNYCQIE